MYWKKLLGITTLSCRVGSIGLRPEWPWRARRCTIFLEESVQYWYLFLIPPPPVMLFFLVVRPMRTVREMFLKIRFNSPELNRSIIFSMYLIAMTKKMNQFLRYFIIGERIFPWFNIGPRSFPNRNGSWGRAGRFSFLWFCFGLWSVCKILRIQFTRIFFELNFWNFLFIVVQIHHKLVWSMRNSDPGVRINSVHRHNSDLNSVFTVQPTSCNFQYGHNLVFPWIHPFGCDVSSSLDRVYSRQATARNCKNCPISTTFRNPASIQILHNSSCCDSFSIRSPNCCNRRSLWVRSSQSKGTSVLITLDTNEELDCPPRLLSSIVKGFVLFTHFCDCSVKTELIYRNNYAKNSLNRFQISTIVHRQFSMSLLLSRPLDNGLVARKIGCPLSANSNIILSVILSHSPCGLHSLIEHHFFSEPGPINDHCPFQNIFAYRETRLTFDMHSFSLSLHPQEMSLIIVMKKILLVKFSDVSPNLNSKLLTSSLSCNVLNPGKYSTRIPLDHRRFCQNFCKPKMIWTIPIFVPMHRSIGCSRRSYEDTIQNLKRRRPLCVEDWWLFHQQSKTHFHEWFSQPIVSTPEISSCSDTNLADMSNICFNVRSFVSVMEWQLSR